MCTLETRGNLFILTLTGATEHRLSPSLIATLRGHLAQIRSQSTPGSVLITTAEGKFFSNGFDLAWAQSAGSASFRSRLHQMVADFKPLVADLLSLPIPTIAAITGHAAAAGFMLAIAHDYVLMRKDRGVMYMSELDIGMTFPDYFMDLMKVKIRGRRELRDVVLAGRKITAEEAVGMGIVDEACGGPEETVEAAVAAAERLGKRKWNGEVYGEIRKSSMKEVLGVLGLDEREVLVAKL